MLSQTWVKRLFTLAANLYALGVVAYLALRLLFGDGFWWLSLLNTFAHLIFVPLLPLLGLAALLRDRVTALRLLPLALVGGLWLLPYFVPRSQASPSGVTLRVVTFNVWGNSRSPAVNEDWLRQVPADVVLLQEITPEYAGQISARLADLYPHQSAHPDPERWAGNVTLSRYPILDEVCIDLETPGCTFPVRLLLDVNGQPVAVYNVHLAWPVGQPRLRLPFRSFYADVLLGFDDSARNAQVDLLLQLLANEPYPFIVAGDFNTSAASQTYHRLASQMNDAFQQAGSGLGKTWPVSVARGIPGFIPPFLRIDYIWHSEHFRAIETRVGPALASDHLPLLATLELLPRP